MATDTRDEKERPGEDEGRLKRAISPKVLVIFVLGDILGTGIYVLAGDVAAEVGGAIWVPLLVAIFLAFFTANSYAELVTKYPRAAGAALYVNKAFGVSFLTFMVAFAVVVSGVTSASAAAQAFGGDYLTEFVDLPLVPVALVFIGLIAIVNFIGISESVRANVVLTIIEASGLAVIIVIGIITLSSGDGSPERAFEFKEGANVPLAILAGAALSFFALLGFEDSVNVAEEAQDPRHSYPRALFTGLGVAAVVYLAVAFTASMVVGTGRLTGSDAPLLEVIKVSDVGISTALFSAVALVAITNTALINMIMASRLTYGMADQGIVPAILGTVHGGRRTPITAILFTTAIAVILISTGDLETLASTTVVLLLAVFTLVNISCLVARRHDSDRDHFRAITAFPVIGAIACLVLLTQQEGDIYVRALLLLGLGVLLWAVNRAISGRVEMSEPEKLSK